MAIQEAQRMNQLLGQGAGSSPEAAQAIKNIDNLVLQFDNNTIPCRASTRDGLLSEFLKAAKDMARVTSGLVSSTRVSATKHGMYSKEASSIIEHLIQASKSAFISDGKTVAMSPEGNTIVKSAEAIIAIPEVSITSFLFFSLFLFFISFLYLFDFLHFEQNYFYHFMF